MYTFEIQYLPGCELCGSDKNLFPDECHCDRCLVSFLRREIKSLEGSE